MEPNTSTPQAPAPVSQPSVPQSPSSFDGPVALIKFAWSTFTKRWKMFLSIIFVPFILYVISVLLFVSAAVVGPGGVIIGFIVLLAAYVFLIAAVPATVQALHKVTVDPGTQVSVKAQYRFGFSVFWSMVLVMIICGFVNQGASMLLVIPGIFVMVSTMLYMYTFVIDGKRNFAALTESFSLVRGRWWGVFGRLIVLVLIIMVVYFITVGIGYLLQLLPIVLTTIIGVIVGLVFFTFMWAFGQSYVYRLYVTLKATRSTNVSTSTFKGWLIAFLCIGAILVPIAIFGILSSVVLVSLNVARTKGLEAQRNASSAVTEIQRQIDAENLNAMQSNQTSLPVQK